jgi:hypothetical protein
MKGPKRLGHWNCADYFLQIADSYWYLHTQPRSHFTQELDVRPYVEKF